MLVLRCTRKLLARVGPPVESPPLSTTALGDWYAQPVAIGHQRLVMLISERSRLPILVPGRDVKNLPRNFPAALAEMLHVIGVPSAAVNREIGEMQQVVIAATTSRSHLGTLNDYSNMLWHITQARPDSTNLDHALWLADTPVRPLGPGWPRSVTRELLG